MQLNNNQPNGVLHRKDSEAHYQLRRYFPTAQFHGFVEQCWLVNWQLAGQTEHIQRNLPDPNFHLVLSKTKLTLLGPVSKAYAYTMSGTGRIIGVKFDYGALNDYLPYPVGQCVDKEFAAKDIFTADIDNILLPLYDCVNDEIVVECLQNYLAAFIHPITVQQATTQQLVSFIKQNEDIVSVEQLAAHANLSVRAVQRYFVQYVGLSPKWLIRKYRLSRALAQLENNSVSILDIVARLEYTDQSHLIKDFKQLLGLTPGSYLKPA